MKTLKELFEETGFIVKKNEICKYENGKYVYLPDPDGGFFVVSDALSDTKKILSDKFESTDIVCHYIRTGRILLFAIKMRGPKLGMFYACSMGRTGIRNYEVFPGLKRLNKVEHYQKLVEFAKQDEFKYIEEETDEFNILGTMMRLEK